MISMFRKSGKSRVRIDLSEDCKCRSLLPPARSKTVVMRVIMHVPPMC